MPTSDERPRPPGRPRIDRDRHGLGPLDVPTPMQMSSLLDRVVKGMGAPSLDAVELVFTRWTDVVGAQLGQRTRPVDLADGTLRIAADDPAVVSHLRYLEVELLDRLRDLLGERRVHRVEVVVDRAIRRRRGR